MFRNYFITAFRNLKHNKSNFFINVTGLAISVAASLLLFTIINYELSYEKFNTNYSRIYRVVTKVKFNDGENFTTGLQSPFAAALRADMPQLKVANINLNYGSEFKVLNNNSGNTNTEKKFKEDKGVVFIEPEYFDIFSSTWLAGNASVLAQPNTVVLDKPTAEKYFGNWQQAVGRLLKMDNLITLKVAGIVKDAPENTDLPFKMYISFISCKPYGNKYGYINDWHTTSSNNQVFVLLPQNVSPQNINNLFPAFIKKNDADERKSTSRIYSLQPLHDMHFDARYGITSGDHIISKSLLLTLSLIGLLIIVMASINFINLSTAQAIGRSKEAGIRKVLGSSRMQLILQIIGETFLIVLSSVVLAVLIAYLTVPYLSHAASVPENISLLNLQSILFLLLVLILITALSGIYPALIISGFKPVVAIKSKINTADVGGISLRRILVVTQFVISQTLIVGTIIAVNQMNYVRNADLGFNKESVYVTENIADSVNLQKQSVLKQQLLQNPNIKSVSFTADPPSSDNNWSTNFYFNHSEKDPGFDIYLKMGDEDYVKTFGIQLLAGNNISKSDTAKEYLINETLMKKLGYKIPQEIIGKALRLGSQQWLPVVGVMKDFNTNSLRETVKPIVLSSNKEYYFNIGIKLNTANLASTLKYIQQKWEATYPDYVFNGNFLDENIAKFYQQENQMELVLKIFAGIAIFISCLGLYGLVSFMAVQRTKEVGIRKVLGASVAHIIYLFSKEFTILIVVAFAIAAPVAWYMMHSWLNNFVFRIHITAWVFVLAIISSIIIAWTTVGYKAVKAAVANPVKSLKTE